MKNSLKLIAFILVLMIMMIPNKIKAKTIYQYANIKTCYLIGVEEPVDTTTIDKTGYKGCLQLDNTRKYKVDKERLQKENACPDGYELYDASQGEDPDKVFGSGCVKEKILNETLYCGYSVNEWQKVMLVYDGKEYTLRTSTKHEADANEEMGEYENEFLNDAPALYVPMYNDKSWRLSELEHSIKDTEKYSNGILSDCPLYVYELYTGEWPNTKVSGYLFTDSTEAWKETESDYSYLRRKKIDTSIQDVDSPNSGENIDDNYYGSFDTNSSCDELEKNAYNRTCTYNLGDYRFIMYMNNNSYHITTDYTGSKFLTYFTFNELKEKNNGECPQDLYWWSDGNLFSVALEDTDNKLYYRNKVTLSASSSELIIPEHCLETNISPSKQNCESLLGSPSTPDTPAYYLSLVFNIMKYIAIVILIVFSIMDFVGAVASQDNDQLKKATNKAVIRLILCVVIFILPTLIEFVLQFIDNREISICITKGGN